MEATVPRTISRDDGEQVPLGGLDIVFKITSDQTGGALAICETAVEPGRLIPAHLHDTEDEFTYVIDGRIGVLVGEEEFTADAGSWVVKPRGTSSASRPRPRDTTTTSAPTWSSH
jgi:quercetin dioxygenase-like cupin family protein